MMVMKVIPTNSELSGLIAAMNELGGGVGLKNTQRALNVVSRSIATAWGQAVGDRKKIKIDSKMPFSKKVYSTDKLVHWLEKGLKSFDMKRTHPYGAKSRRSKAGHAYLIIPFKHKTKDGKSREGQKSLSDVYQMVRKQMQGGDFQRSFVSDSPAKSDVSQENAFGEQIKRATYRYGTRIEFPDTPEFQDLQGMVVMGGPKQSQFMTFRVVSVNSPADSWIHPGITARNYLQNIVESGQGTIGQIIEDALRRDLR
jgi:hypothetical protein